MRYTLQNPNTPYTELEEIRQELHKLALTNYKPANEASDYLSFLNDYECKFEIVGIQD